MSLARLAWAYLAARPLLTALHLAMLALGVGTMVFLVLATAQAERRLGRDAAAVDLVVGAKGSPLQLILSSVLHLDVPTGNIPRAEAMKVAADPMVALAVPIALGDSHRGHRIVGTEASFLRFHGATLASGRGFQREMEAVLGAETARDTGYAPGARFPGTHGLADGGAAHAEEYTVVGVLAPTGTVVDRLVLTPLESVWHTHGGTPDPGDTGEITALLVRYRTPLAAAVLPRRVNSTTSLQAASPAYENARLMNLVGVGLDTLRAFAMILLATAAVSVFVALTSALQERRYDLALLRTLGARPASLFALVAAEGVTLVVAGVILGFGLGHAAAEVLGRWLAATRSWSITGFAWEPAEVTIAAAVLAAGLVTSLIPALQAYRRDPAILLKR